MITRKIAPLVGVPLLTLVLTSCGGFAMPGDGEERQASAQTTGSGSGAESGSAAEGGQSAQPATAPPQADQEITAREVRSQGFKKRLAVTQLRREGKLAMLQFTITNLEGGTWTINWSLRAQNKTAWDISGVSLIDPANAKRYRAAFSGDVCVCSTAEGVSIANGKTHSFYAAFAAPPPDVTKVNVEIPNHGVFTDVPIS
jgi:hypothetical protein